MIRAMLDADTETFETGPYERAVRIRKYVYLSAAATAVLAQRWFADSDILSVIGISEIPDGVLHKSASATLAYFLCQYFLVLAQTASLYPNILTRRFGERSRARQIELEGELRALREKQIVDDDAVEGRKSELRARQNHAHQQRDTNEVAIVERALAQLEREQELTMEAREKQEIRLAEQYREAIRSDHGRNPVIRASEIALDVLRLGPPIVVGAYTLFMLGIAPWL